MTGRALLCWYSVTDTASRAPLPFALRVSLPSWSLSVSFAFALALARSCSETILPPTVVMLVLGLGDEDGPTPGLPNTGLHLAPKEPFSCCLCALLRFSLNCCAFPVLLGGLKGITSFPSAAPISLAFSASSFSFCAFFVSLSAFPFRGLPLFFLVCSYGSGEVITDGSAGRACSTVAGLRAGG